MYKHKNDGLDLITVHRKQWSHNQLWEILWLYLYRNKYKIVHVVKWLFQYWYNDIEINTSSEDEKESNYN